ncbi:MAG: T9SS type A sorting domain-containing protein [Bacteroidota bacterium]
MKNSFILFVLFAFVFTSAGFAQKNQTVAYPYGQLPQQFKSYSRNNGVMQSVTTNSNISQATTAQLSTAATASTVYDITSLSNSITAGGDRLVATQNSDGGWGWPVSGVSAKNTIGPIAMGLAQAYLESGSSSHLAALSRTASFLLTKTNNFSSSDGYLAAQLDKIFGGNTYSSFVKANFFDKLDNGTYNRNGAGTLYSTTSYIQLLLNTRGNLAAWDLGLGLVGAASCGANTTEWIAGVKQAINQLNGNNYYDVLGLAGAIYGLAFVHEDFNPTAGQHASANNINDLANTLASYQIAGGGFAWNQAWVIPNDGDEAMQETAYSILALAEVNRAAFSKNILGAAYYLMSVQLANGGWEGYVGYGENNEVTGEVLWALSSISANDMKVAAENEMIPYTSNSDKKMRRAAQEAVKHINESLDADLWVDLNHLSDKGEKVFDEEKDAVESLSEKKFTGQFSSDALTTIKFLVTADKKLAQTAINEVVCNGDSKCENNLHKANEQMAKAALAFSNGDYGKAIDGYKSAWKKVSSIREEDDHNNQSLSMLGAVNSSNVNPLPSQFELDQNYPNPFNPSTVIRFQLPQSSFVIVKVYDILGQEVKTLVNGVRDSGSYNVQWNGDNNFGAKVASGIYIYRIQAGTFSQSMKMILMK